MTRKPNDSRRTGSVSVLTRCDRPLCIARSSSDGTESRVRQGRYAGVSECRCTGEKRRGGSKLMTDA